MITETSVSNFSFHRTRTSSSSRSGQLTQINLSKIHQTYSYQSTSSLDPFKTTGRIFPPIVTAAAWSIHDLKTGEVLWEKRSDEQREMASLTKMMTCLLCHHLLNQLNEDPEKLVFTVNRIAAKICGTHSGLREGEKVRVIDLLHGLMLPSGNDCAIVLAYGFGDLLLKAKKSRVVSSLPVNPAQVFIREMNKLALKLGLKSTNFTNPHGLSEKGNKSTATDLGKLGYFAMGVPLIEKIVSTKIYNAEVFDSKGKARILTWKNTNKLLDKGFDGLKTGTTPNAGLCLCSVLRDREYGVIVTLLHAKTESHRWNESEKLARWGLNTLLSVKDKMEILSETNKAKLTAKLIADIARNL